jgi:flagellar protein FlgJ
MTVAPISPVATGITPAGSTDRARLHQAAQAFEAIFVRQMLSSARQSNFGDTLWGDDKGQDTFSAMRDERFADLTAQSGTLGLARQVEADLAKRLDATPAAPATEGRS